MSPRWSSSSRLAIASGRRSRAIYPVVALREAPDVLRARARAGEQIRLLPDLPTRLMVIGTTHAVVPEPLGYADEPRLLVRQGALVEALILLFDELWARAAAGARSWTSGRPGPTCGGFLLQMLGAGPEGRADRPRSRAEPAHGTPADRRPDVRAGRRLAVPGRRRGGAAGVGLSSGPTRLGRGGGDAGPCCGAVSRPKLPSMTFSSAAWVGLPASGVVKPVDGRDC